MLRALFDRLVPTGSHASETEHVGAEDRRFVELCAQVSGLEDQVRRLESELALMPTAEEITTWQKGIEASQAEANVGLSHRLAAALDQPGRGDGTRSSTGVPGTETT